MPQCLMPQFNLSFKRTNTLAMYNPETEPLLQRTSDNESENENILNQIQNPTEEDMDQPTTPPSSHSFKVKTIIISVFILLISYLIIYCIVIPPLVQEALNGRILTFFGHFFSYQSSLILSFTTISVF